MAEQGGGAGRGRGIQRRGFSPCDLTVNPSVLRKSENTCVQERMHRRLADMQARKDLQLVIGKPQDVGMHLWFGRTWDNS